MHRNLQGGIMAVRVRDIAPASAGEEERFMAEDRVPNLEELGEQEAYRFLTELFSTLSPEEVYEANHPRTT
jgi:hypothetical protein